jgi:hypothetical protein
MDTEIKLKVTNHRTNQLDYRLINLNEKNFTDFCRNFGQETVRHFFRSGGSSGTIAKQCQRMIKTLVMRFMELKKTVVM